MGIKHLKLRLSKRQALFLLVLFSSALLSLAFLRSVFAVLVFVALIPLCIIVPKTERAIDAWLYGFWFGFFYTPFAFSWEFAVYPAPQLFPSAMLALTSLVIVIAIEAFVAGVLFGLFTLALRTVWYLPLKVTAVARTFLYVGTATLLLPAMEYLRMWGYTLLWAGPWKPVPFLTTGALGYLVAPFQGLVQLARFGDVYTLSAFVAFVSATVAVVYLTTSLSLVRKAGSILLLVVCLLGLNSVLWSVYKNPIAARTLHVIAVGLALSPGEDALPAEQAALKDRIVADALVLFPEGFGEDVLNSLLRPPLVSVYQVPHSTGSEKHASAVYVTAASGVPVRVEKEILVPAGEYLPLSGLAVLSVVSPKLASETDAKFHLLPGAPATPVPTPFGFLGVLFCNEVLAPAKVHALSQEGARLIAVPASRAFFSYSQTLEDQTLEELTVRAVASNVTIVQATNKGTSYVITSDGAIAASAGYGEVLDTYLAPP